MEQHWIVHFDNPFDPQVRVVEVPAQGEGRNPEKQGHALYDPRPVHGKRQQPGEIEQEQAH